MIPALVLSAGLATRLRPVSLVRAKAAFPVAGQPLVRRIVTWLRAAGVTDVVVNLHHLPHTVAGVLGDGSDLGARVRYSWEHPILGSAGGPRLALPLVEGSTCLIANGDTLTDVDISALVADHRRSGALVTLAVTTNPDATKYGGIEAGPDGAMLGVVPRGSNRVSWHFVGVQVVEAEAFAGLEPGTPAESVGALYPALIAARPGAVRVHVSQASFLDIGTPDDYLRTSLLVARREGRSDMVGERTHVAPGSHVEDSVLWDDVEVGPRATLRACIVTDGVRVPADSHFADVSLRIATDVLMASEHRVGALAVAPI